MKAFKVEIKLLNYQGNPPKIEFDPLAGNEGLGYIGGFIKVILGDEVVTRQRNPDYSTVQNTELLNFYKRHQDYISEYCDCFVTGLLSVAICLVENKRFSEELDFVDSAHSFMFELFRETIYCSFECNSGIGCHQPVKDKPCDLKDFMNEVIRVATEFQKTLWEANPLVVYSWLYKQIEKNCSC